ncbi:cytochrome P450 [Calocera cornea HHB12733]|uniref:Cytochrome P450 n=1 Tax=Calocera cornea HHB12733 TaxID=1353952 RepID=A0A165D0W7_9BASI|nr:cytochrome P450 [Calocera cornea HHB12733]
MLDLSLLSSLRPADLAVGLLAILLLSLLLRKLLHSRYPKLRGPPRPSWLYGWNRTLLLGTSGDFYESWQKEYGDVFSVPTAVGGIRLAIMDPKAIAHVLTAHAYNYVRPEGQRKVLVALLGDGLITVEGDDHKRHRKTMTPGFTPAAIRAFTSIFLECAHKVKDEWNALMLAENKESDYVLDVDPWINAISLDSIGAAGFGYDFHSTSGSKPVIQRLLDVFGSTRQSPLTLLILSLIHVFPWLTYLPSNRTEFRKKLRGAMTDVAVGVMEERHKVGEEGRRSLIESVSESGFLVRAENRTFSQDEVLAAVGAVLLGPRCLLSGNRSTPSCLRGTIPLQVSISWSLHELSSHPSVQSKLRAELSLAVPSGEPTYDQLHGEKEMPYLDAVVKEVLRCHPAIVEIFRVVRALKEDSLPLARPLTTTSGKQISGSLPIPAGQGLAIPIEALVRSPLLWGADSHEFKPERWLHDGAGAAAGVDGLPERAREVQGWSHLMTFLDGPRACIGRNFAIAEVKAVLCTLVQNFKFEPWKEGGRDVKRVVAVTPRPRNEGVQGLKLRISRVELD